MKFSSAVLFLLACAPAFVSCDDETRTLRNETTDDVIWKSKEIRVLDTEWQKFVDRDGMNCYFKCNKKVSDLTYAVLDGGMVNCYLYVDNSDTQAQLPTVRHFENREGHLWTRTIDYEYYSGGVTFYVTDSDFAGEQPGTMDFRLMLAY